MAEYRAPTDEIRFVLETITDMATWEGYEGFEEAGEDLVLAVLEEASKIANDVIAPTNRAGDTVGAVLKDGEVTTPDCFKPMHKAYVEGGWPTLAFSPEYGGQGLPGTLALAVGEMVTSANMAYSLNPLLTSGAIEAIAAHGNQEQKDAYLPRMISGEWTGAMNLTEPSAGSDVGALKAKAEPQADGSYKITGQKIFITWGDHDLADNVIHLVLARTPTAPAGTRGISMFIVPKFLLDENGDAGPRNDVKCVSLEHKLGIHASPTCVMSFGDEGNCIGYLVGEENRGMRNMFTMMNHARVGVGLQGVSMAERAYQDAVAYAKERVQGPAVGSDSAEATTIIHHPDVRRMLMTMRANTEASRALVYLNAWALDRAHHAGSEEERAKASGEADLLTPMSKAFATDIGVSVSSLAIQVFGGMGFIEETGVAQHYRDARIAPIYEGTNGIQAMDLVGRKLMMAGGSVWRTLLDEMDASLAEISVVDGLATTTAALQAASEDVRRCSEHLYSLGGAGHVDVASACVPYLTMFAGTLGGWLLARQAARAAALLASGEGSAVFLQSKQATAAFYAEQLLPLYVAQSALVVAGSKSVMAIAPDAF